MHLTETVGERLLLTLWVGALWSIGYLAVPLAFVNIDATIAAEYAGKLFFAVNVVGLISGILLLSGKIILMRGKVLQFWRFWVLVGMIIITLLLSTYLQPEMAAIKLVENWRMDDELALQFDRLHLLSRNFYLMLSIAGLLLVLSSDKPSTASRT